MDSPEIQLICVLDFVFGPRAECKPKCDYRCSNTKYRKPCLFFCNKCCRTCLCVPSAFYGHREECACYNDWKTKEGGHKCP
jgi:hypothetical protein